MFIGELLLTAFDPLVAIFNLQFIKFPSTLTSEYQMSFSRELKAH